MTERDEQLRTVIAMFDAFTRLDRDEFVGYLTEDVDFRPSAFVTGKGQFHGREDVRQNLAELPEQLERSGDRIRHHLLALYVDGEDKDKILALARLTVIPPSGDSFDTEVAHLHTMRGDQVAELRTWLDHQEGLSQLARPERVEFPD